MVSTRNTSRSHANPPRMQDQQGNVDSRPPEGTLETLHANTDEMEALRLTNQRLLRELGQLTRKIQRSRRRDRPEKAKTPLPKKNSNTSNLLEKQMEKEKLAKPMSMTLTNPLERIAMRRGMVGTTEAMDPSFIRRRQGSGHGSRGSRTSNKSSTI